MSTTSTGEVLHETSRITLSFEPPGYFTVAVFGVTEFAVTSYSEALRLFEQERGKKQ